MPDTDRPIVPFPETQNDLRANKTTFRNKINSDNSYLQVQEHWSQSSKDVRLGHLNVNCLRNKIEAVEELMRNNINISLFSETKLDETFPNQQYKISGYKMFRRDRNKHGFPNECEVTLIELSSKSRK